MPKTQRDSQRYILYCHEIPNDLLQLYTSTPSHTITVKTSKMSP